MTNKHITELLDKHFDIALETPDGIKKLRELILSLAMQGKLVPQAPNDQPASELLKEIQAEKARLIKEGKIKKQEPLAPIKDSEIPYKLPKGWEWVRLGSIFTLKSGVSFAKEDELPIGKYLYLKVGEMNLSENQKTITTSSIFLKDDKKVINSLIPENSIIFPKRGGAIATNKKRIVEFPICVDTNIMAITCPNKINILYSFNWLLTHDLALLNTGTSVPQINNKDIAPLFFPLPPLNEQKRIVAKIDQLMALCDKLEAQRDEHNKKRLTIHTASMNKLLTAPDSATFNESWNFITSNFEQLYSVTPNVADLKKMILQLAVMGKLVPQDPNDQPASELLKEIQAEKAKLIKEGKIKKQEPLPPIKDSEIPYILPKGWAWVKLDNICTLITDGTHHTPTYVDSGIPFISVKNLSSGVLSFEDTKFVSKEEHEILIKRCNPELFDILLTKVGTTGIAVTVNTEKEFSIFVSVSLLKILPEKVYPFFLENLINSPMVKKYSKEGTEGVGNKNLVLRKIKEFIIPIPPFNEQKRIVAKIDQLMNLCNDLEKHIKDSTEKKKSILNSVLAKI